MVREFVMTNHALERALEMKLDGAEIRAAVMSPEESHWSEKHDAECRTAGRVTAPCRIGGQDGPVVLTLLWATRELWEQAYLENPAPGREPRDMSDWKHQ